MKKVFLLSVLVMSAAAFQLDAQTPVASFSSKVKSSCVSFDYTYAVKNNLNMKGGGHVTVQDGSFVMTGNSLEMHCDGKTVWTLDDEAEEMVIESVGESEGVTSNPAVLVSSLDNAFTAGPMEPSVFKGKKVDMSVLTPKPSVSGIKTLNLYFSGEKLVGAVLVSDDGTTTEFGISNIKFSSKKPLSFFSFSDKAPGPSWVVTDLR